VLYLRGIRILAQLVCCPAIQEGRIDEIELCTKMIDQLFVHSVHHLYKKIIDEIELCSVI